MRVLILSTATGQGHNSAAESVKEYFESHGCEAVLLDVLKLTNKDISSPVSRLYANITVHTPWFFGFLYHLGDFISSAKRRSPVYYFNAKYADSLYKKITEFNPDVIVCPHLFGAEVITKIREQYGLKTPTVYIATDYTCIPFTEETRLDVYIIPAKELIDEFAKKGIPKEKIVPLGIPVKARFKSSTPKSEARKRLGLCAKHVYVIMGGSMGYGKMDKLASAILRRDKEAQVAVLCGRNENLYKKLLNKQNVVPFEYIDGVDIIMDAADVLLTKPGGLSSTEALVKGVPTVLTCPIPGCESKNAEFLSSFGMAVSAKSVSKAADAAVDLVRSPRKVQRMIEAQNKNIDKDATKKVGDLIFELVRNAGRS